MEKIRGGALCLVFCYAAIGCTTENFVDSKSATNNIPSESLRFFNAQNLDNTDIPKFTEGYVAVGGNRLHYVSGGTGKLVVFHHGFPSYWYLWKNQLKALANNYRVVAFDGLGSNLSDKPTEVSAYTVDKLTTQLRAAIDKLAAGESYILVGHDWGGALAWAYAQTNPPGLEKLIVLNAPPYNLFLELLRSNPDQQQASQYIKRLKSAEGERRLKENNALGFWKAGGYEKFVARGLISQAEGELFKTSMAQPGAVTGGINWYRANIPAFDDISEQDFWPMRSAGTSVDSMLIWGETDKTFVPAFMEQLPDYTNRLRIETLPGVGHTPQLESPEKVTRLIMDFIESE